MDYIYNSNTLICLSNDGCQRLMNDSLSTTAWQDRLLRIRSLAIAGYTFMNLLADYIFYNRNDEYHEFPTHPIPLINQRSLNLKHTLSDKQNPTDVSIINTSTVNDLLELLD